MGSSPPVSILSITSVDQASSEPPSIRSQLKSADAPLDLIMALGGCHDGRASNLPPQIAASLLDFANERKNYEHSLMSLVFSTKSNADRDRDVYLREIGSRELRLQELEQKNAGLEREKAKFEAQITSMVVERMEDDAHFLVKIKSEIECLISENRVVANKIEAISNENRSEIEESNFRISGLEGELEGERRKFAELEAEFERFKKTGDKKTCSNCADLVGEIERIREGHFEELLTKDNTIFRLENLLDEASINLNDLKANLENRRKSESSEASKLKIEMSDLRKILKEESDKNGELENKIWEMEAEFGEIMERHRQTYNERGSKISKLEHENAELKKQLNWGNNGRVNGGGVQKFSYYDHYRRQSNHWRNKNRSSYPGKNYKDEAASYYDDDQDYDGRTSSQMER